MTAYETIVSLYDLFHRAYGWTVAEIDATGLDYLLTLMRVRRLLVPIEGEKLCAIDEVL